MGFFEEVWELAKFFTVIFLALFMSFGVFFCALAPFVILWSMVY